MQTLYAGPTTRVAPLTVVFTSTSGGDYVGSLWDFGDEVTSTLESPSHTYTATGAYAVTLTVSGPEGSDTETKGDYVLVSRGGKLPPRVGTYEPHGVWGRVGEWADFTTTYTDPSGWEDIQWAFFFLMGHTSVLDPPPA